MSGHPREAEESLRVFWQRPLPAAVNRRAAFADKVEQGADGLWATPRDEYDSQGQAVWGLLSHYRITGDRQWLEKVYPAIRNGAEWTRAARRTTKINKADGTHVPYYGLFPAGFGEAISENHNGVWWGKTNVLYHDFWGVLGLRLGAEAAELLGHEEDAKWIRAEYEDFRRCVNEACKREFVPLPDGGYWKAAWDLDRGQFVDNGHLLLLGPWWQSSGLVSLRGHAAP